MNPFDSYSTPSLSPLNIGPYVVLRHPLRGTANIRYVITLNGERLGAQLSFPSPQDCDWHNRFGKTARSHPARRPLRQFESPTLTGRIVEVLRLEKMRLTELANTLGTQIDTLAPILTRLVNDGRIQREGARGSYIYQASATL